MREESAARAEGERAPRARRLLCRRETARSTILADQHARMHDTKNGGVARRRQCGMAAVAYGVRCIGAMQSHEVWLWGMETMPPIVALGWDGVGGRKRGGGGC